MIDGFEKIRPDLFVRRGEGAAEELCGLLADPLRGSAESGDGGRGTARRAVLADGRVAWRRAYRHGGLLGALLGGTYLGLRTRPEREIRAVEAARSAGILAPLPLAFGVWRTGPLYRAVLVSVEIPQRRSLRAVLSESSDVEEIRAWLGSLVRDVRRLHAAGVHHPDLNLTNLLAGTAPGESLAFLDFDRARVFAGPVPARWQWLAVRRLRRSLAKLSPMSAAPEIFKALWQDS